MDGVITDAGCRDTFNYRSYGCKRLESSQVEARQTFFSDHLCVAALFRQPWMQMSAIASVSACDCAFVSVLGLREASPPERIYCLCAIRKERLCVSPLVT